MELARSEALWQQLEQLSYGRGATDVRIREVICQLKEEYAAALQETANLHAENRRRHEFERGRAEGWAEREALAQLEAAGQQATIETLRKQLRLQRMGLDDLLDMTLTENEPKGSIH